jgi:hypothetical protein
MIRALKTLLFWLLIAALPLQGAVAAMQVTCAPAAYAEGQGGRAAAGHHQEGAASHADGGGASAASDAPFNSDKQPATPHNHQSSSCSACAACCVGASAPPSMSLPAPAEGSSEFVVTPRHRLVTGFIPAGLDRPPKRIAV